MTCNLTHMLNYNNGNSHPKQPSIIDLLTVKIHTRNCFTFVSSSSIPHLTTHSLVKIAPSMYKTASSSPSSSPSPPPLHISSSLPSPLLPFYHLLHLLTISSSSSLTSPPLPPYHLRLLQPIKSQTQQ